MDPKLTLVRFALIVLLLMGYGLAQNEPVLSNIEGTALNYTEGDGPTIITSSLTITEPNGDLIQGAAISIDLSTYDNSEDVLDFTPQAGINGIFNPALGILVLSGPATAADYQAALRTVTYHNTDNVDPSPLVRTIRFGVTDGLFVSNEQSRDIYIEPIIDAARGLPFCESFETDGEGARYTSYTFENGCAFFKRHLNSAADPCHNDQISNDDGDYIWLSEDVISAGNYSPNGNGQLLLAPFIATPWDSFTVVLRLGISNDNGLEWDELDKLLLQYNIDENGWNTFGAFYGDDPLAGDLRQDEDLDGTADPTGLRLTTTMQQVSFGLNISGDELQIRILLDQNGENEELGIDDICISGYTTSCAITNITLGTSYPCTPSPNQYSQEIYVHHLNMDPWDIISVDGAFHPVQPSPQLVLIENKTATGNSVDVTVQSLFNPTCVLTIADLYVAPGNSDGDTHADACDECPNDANKIVVGTCGCGIADVDSDNNGQMDCTPVRIEHTSGACQSVPTIVSTGAGIWQQIIFNGELIAEINDNGNVLGNVACDVYIHDGAIRVDGSGTRLLDRNFRISPDTQPLSPVSVRLYFPTNELTDLLAADPNTTDISELRVTKTSDNTCLLNYGGTGGTLINSITSQDYSTNAHYLQFDVSSFSNFFPHGTNPSFPVEWAEFNALPENEGVQLHWSTLNELNNSRFVVQHSIDGRLYQNIGSVLAAGNSQIVQSYSFFDEKPILGLNYYRLKQVDQDGSFGYSNVETVIFDLPSLQIQLFPNPVGQVLHVGIGGAEDHVLELEILDILGRVLKTQTIPAGTKNIQLDVASLVEGAYIIRVGDAFWRVSERFIKM